jgi:hypothetical protein
MVRGLISALFAVLMLAVLQTEGYSGRRYGLEEMLYGHRPGARGEGLGRGGVALAGDVASSAYNPAGLGGATGLSFMISGTNYCNDIGCDNDYLYIAGSLPVKDYGVLGLSRYHYDRGPVAFATGSPGHDGAASLEDIWLYTLTFATEPAEDLYVGASVNLLRSGYYRAGADNVLYGDLGVTKVFGKRLSRSTAHSLTVASSVSNFNGTGTANRETEEGLPVVFRLGGSYSLGWEHASSPKGLQTLKFTVHTEFQDLLNTAQHNAVSLGAEVLILEILALRLGRYWEEIDDDQPDGDQATTAETTFGWGITIPAYSLTRGRLPFNFSLDRVRLDPPEAAPSGDEYRILTFSLTWSF